MPLRPDYVGQRVIVRRRLPGETGPSGGPAMTDVLGILTAWDDATLTVERDGGGTVQIAHADVVTGKPIPPRGSTRLRINAERLQHICGTGWRAPVERPLGDWLLRSAAGFTARANSVRVAGDPGLPTDSALVQVSAFYGEVALQPMAQVVVGSPWLAQIESRGWSRARDHDADTDVLVASVAQARRIRRATSKNAENVSVTDDVSADWLRIYGRTDSHDPAAVRHVLTTGEVCFVSVGDPVAAIGRGVISGDWLGLAAVEVRPERRGEGLSAVVVEALLSWGASRGALSAYLQTLTTNAAAIGLYAGYGFTPHHAYRYLIPQ